MAKLATKPASAGVEFMILNPFRLYRRYRRLQREALDEALFMRRRHGEAALTALRERLDQPELTQWGRKVLERSAELIRKRRID